MHALELYKSLVAFSLYSLATSVSRLFHFKLQNDSTIYGQVRVVATVENMYDILDRIHCKESGHVGYKKVIAEVGCSVCKN